MTFGQIFNDRCINLRAFARVNNIAPTTLYSIVSGKCNPQNISVGTWVKIANGLNMTADELYAMVFLDV